MKKFTPFLFGVSARRFLISSCVCTTLCTISIEAVRAQNAEQDSLRKKQTQILDEVSVFGSRSTPPDNLQAITRMPIPPQEQIQSISVIGNALLEQQGALTVSEAIQNIPGVYTFSTWGGMRESFGSRGYRDITMLKNGVPLNANAGFLIDMQGVDNIQAIKGTAAITQGFVTGRGGGLAGGLLNIVTKTPKMGEKFGGNVSVRAGAWVPSAKHGKGNTFQAVRPTFDIWGSLNKSKTLAVRLSGAYEYSEGFRVGTDMQRVYVNPSIAWFPNKKTRLIVEGDYLNDLRTPDGGTVNLSSTGTGNIYDLPFNKNIGFDNVRTRTQVYSYAARFERDLIKHLTFRVAVFGSGQRLSGNTVSRNGYQRVVTDEMISGLGAANTATSGRKTQAEFLSTFTPNTKMGEMDVERSIGTTGNHEVNNLVQMDLVGKDFETGIFKHTFQVGMDFRNTSSFSGSYTSVKIDTINLLTAPEHSSVSAAKIAQSARLRSSTTANENAYGALAQYRLTISRWVNIFVSARYTFLESYSVSRNTNARTGVTSTTTAYTSDGGVNPMAGLIFNPLPNIHIYGSYNYSLSPRTAAQVDINGKLLSSPKTQQVEAGIKTEWFNKRLRANLALYTISLRDQNLQAVIFDGVLWQAQPYYFKGGNERSRGVELEVSGNITKNLEVVAGWSFVDARYLDHTRYEKNSFRINTPRNTVNFWAHYRVLNDKRRGVLALSAGVYYIGTKYYNNRIKMGTEFHGIMPGEEPWQIPAYTLLKAQVSYTYKHYGVRLFLNNLLDQVGWTNYRDNYINRIDPRSIAIQVSYHF